MKKSLITLATTLTLLSGVGITSLNASPMKAKKSKPFLIQGKLPHLTMMVKKMWDDKDVALTSKQKKELIVVRKETLHAVKALKKKITLLENEIVKASFADKKPQTLQKKVEHLAQLRADATMVHLRCIYQTRKILTKDQLDMIE
jgi:hypothetical protein